VWFDPITEGREMLVLSRKMGETITIGDKIVVSIIKLEKEFLAAPVEVTKQAASN
jgi:carbon storage regulator CsrA